MANAYALRLLGFLVGTALLAFLAFTARRHRIAFGAALAGAIWHGSNAAALTALVTVGRMPGILPRLGDAAMAIAAVLQFQFAMSLTGRNPWLAAPLYGAAVWVWFTGTAVETIAAIALAGAGAVLVWLPEVRRFETCYAASLLLWLAGSLAGVESSIPVWTSLAPPLCLAYFIYRCNVLDLSISRRALFALLLGVLSAVYLLAVKLAASWAELEFRAFGSFLEILLLLAAFLVWIPLSAWMTRFLASRTQTYADLSQRLIEKAVAILDLEQRLQFIAAEIGRTFRLRRVLLVTAGEPPARGEYGPDPGDDVGNLVDAVSRELDFSGLLPDSGFNYLFPLRYEERLVGLLLLDTRPRRYLDEYEPILSALSHQISHSIESCRLIAEKVGLERTLLQQEHLATLGTLAARVAHEVRNPLGAIQALAQNMQRDESLDARYRQDLDYILSETDRLNRCVQGVLDFSRPAGDTPRDAQISELLASIARTLSLEYASRKIRVEAQTAGDWTVPGAGRQAVQQVILNLALNAVQASPRGGRVTLIGGCHADRSRYVSVVDEGPGIPQEMRASVFEPWVTTKPSGTGLGLSIVAKHVKDLGGAVQIDEILKGASVTVTLPAA